MTALVIVNVVLALASCAFGVVALVAPARLSGQQPDSPYYRRMYAVRALAFGVALAVVLVTHRDQAGPWLVAAGVIQVLDAAIGFTRRIPAAVAAPALAGVVHLVSAMIIGR